MRTRTDRLIPKAAVALVVLSMLTAALMFSSVPAFATVTNRFEFSFGGEETPQHSFDPGAVAVDQSGSVSAGDVYVVDDNGVVDKFSGAGKYLSQITGAGTPQGAFSGGLIGIAVDPVSGDVYVVDVSRELVYRFGPSGEYLSEITGLEEPEQVAVGGVGGEVYIIEFGKNGEGETVIKRFDPSTATLSTFATGTASGPFPAFGLTGLAVDNSVGSSAGDVYVVDHTDEVVDKFNAAGGFEEPALSEAVSSGVPSEPLGVGVDPRNGNVFVSTSTPRPGEQEPEGGIDGFSPTGEFVERIAGLSTGAQNIAVSPNGELYVSQPESLVSGQRNPSAVDVFAAEVTVPDVTTGAATEVLPRSATLNGTVNTDGLGVTECELEYVAASAYQSEATNPYVGGQSVSCAETPAEIGQGSEPVEVHAAITGLTAGVTYHFRLKAANANGANFGLDQTLSTPPPPSIDSVTATNVRTESVDLNAQINPDGADPATYETTYSFEFGTSTAYGETVGRGVIPAGTSDVAVSVPVEKLTANKTYHYRVVATNGNGATVSTDHTFVYDTSGGGLPDDRAYEMVTPPQKNGALIGGTFILGLSPEISADGSRVMAPAIQCFADAGSCTGLRKFLGSPYEFTRTSSGWQTTALAPPATQFAANTAFGYNPTEGTALLSMPTKPDEEDDWYARQSDGSFDDIGPIMPPSGGADVPPVTEYYASANFSHIAWQTITAGTPWPFAVGTQESTVYGYTYTGAENARPYSIAVSGGLDSKDLIGECGLGSGSSGGPGVLSEDGRTFFFTVNKCGNGSGVNANTSVPVNELFARAENGEAGAHTVAISQPSAISPAPPSLGCTTTACIENTSNSSQFRNAWFEGASADGSEVFFTSTQQLTDTAGQDNSGGDAPTGSKSCNETKAPNGCNLYEYDFSSPVGRRLIDLSAGDTSGEGPRVRGLMAMTSDGSHVYFVAQGILTSGANSQGQTAKDGANNLYVYERDTEHPAGQVTFIAALPSTDANQWTEKTGDPSNVTPDGRFLVFMSSGRLTSDDTSVSGALQVFRYDAQSGELVRISVGNDGFNDNGNRTTGTPCARGGECSQNARIAPATSAEPLSVPRLDPTMSDNGEYVFFQSPEGLTPQALDDVRIETKGDGTPEYAQNVYEWHAGHVYLISDGRDVNVDKGQAATCASQGSVSSVCLLGADATGSDVFFSTDDQLVPQDNDTQLDYYDARIGGGFPVPASLQPCLGEVCHGTPAATPPTPGTPSATFNGQGNLISPVAVVVKKTKTKNIVKCAKSKKRSHGKCPRAKRGKKRPVRRAVSHKGGK